MSLQLLLKSHLLSLHQQTSFIKQIPKGCRLQYLAIPIVSRVRGQSLSQDPTSDLGSIHQDHLRGPHQSSLSSINTYHFGNYIRGTLFHGGEIAARPSTCARRGLGRLVSDCPRSTSVVWEGESNHVGKQFASGTQRI